jgi:cobalt/nickel transport system ATP-binding protein
MLRTEGLCYKYEDGTIALNNININLNKGKIISFIGKNGAGKSTLFLNLMGIFKPYSGKIFFENRELEYNRKYLRNYRQKISMVFQDPDKQIFNSNVFDEIAFALRNIGMEEEAIKTKVEEVIFQVDMESFRNKPVHLLSFGQKKRVTIAGALVMDCDILLFDEPTAGLDPFMNREMGNFIQNLSGQGKTIITSSHDMDFVFENSDYVYLMDKGEIVFEGIPETVFKEEEILERCGLAQPWLMKIHQKLGVPLFRKEEELFIKTAPIYLKNE